MRSQHCWISCVSVPRHRVVGDVCKLNYNTLVILHSILRAVLQDDTWCYHFWVISDKWPFRRNYTVGVSLNILTLELALHFRFLCENSLKILWVNWKMPQKRQKVQFMTRGLPDHVEVDSPKQKSLSSISPPSWCSGIIV